MAEAKSNSDPAEATGHARHVAVPRNIIEDLIDAIQELRHAVDPVESMRPLSISEAAKALRCRRDQVDTLIHGGSLPCIKRNGRRYVLQSDIRDYLRNESRCLAPRPRRASVKRLKMEDVDPALREFFT